MDHPLDNPAWNALISGNKRFAKGNKQVKYFSPEISPFVGFPDFSLNKLDLLYHIIPDQRTLAIISPKDMVIPDQWEIIEHMKALQMIHDNPASPGTADTHLIPLQKKHVPEMIALTGMTHPGPFLKRTIEFGNYFGIFNNNNQLVAMAGQRLHVNEYMEISAVCSHPDYLGKGYASQLITHQIHRIKAEARIPFLHVKDDNTKAIHLYKKLGFEARKQLDIYIIQKKLNKLYMDFKFL
jgi:GNAT superfamily N-acetyltransferase